MILTCPECATSYFVDDAKIPRAGREVRCAACGTRWMATQARPAEADLELDIVQADAPAAGAPIEAIEPPALRPRPNREALPKAFRAKVQEKKSVKAAAAAGAVWGGMGLMLALIVGAAFLFRVDIVRIWPRTASAYASLRVPVNPLGLEFEDVAASPALKDGHAALIVTGKIRNTKDQAVESPPLRIELLDKAGKRIAAKFADPENALIPPGETRHFSVSLLDPPLAAQDAEVGFALNRKVAKKTAPVQPPARDVSLRGPIQAAPVAPAPPVAPL
ncbi:MAG: hypothetical protein JWO33_237, partial [Caulobacteraceae bacterium]|nr:hypothetical protein [Caulobacteraceae bacterium]